MPNLEQTGLLRDRLRRPRRAGRPTRTAGRRPTAALARRRPGAAAPRSCRRCSTSCAASSRSRSTYLRDDCQDALQRASRQRLDRRRGRYRRRTSPAGRHVAYPRRREPGTDHRSDLYLSGRGELRPVPARAHTSFGLDTGRRSAGRSSDLLKVLARRAWSRRSTEASQRRGRYAGPSARLPGYRLAARRCAGAPATASAASTTRSACRTLPERRRPARQPVLPRPLPRRRRATAPASRRASTPRRCRPDEREEREEPSARRELPLLYCSPTMELGVDIAELNAVDLRNVPPTPPTTPSAPAAPAARGQPALVFTYCSTGNATTSTTSAARPDGRRARSRRRGSTSPTRTSSAPTSTPSGSPRPAESLGRAITERARRVDGDETPNARR